MKYCLFILIVYFATDYNYVSYANKTGTVLAEVYRNFQKDPFYFVNPVPAKVRLFDGIDLSFFRSRLIVFMYRYRLEIISGGETSINMKLLGWSSWVNTDLTEIKIPRLDQEGGYKLVIEYNTLVSTEIRRYEKLFYVYRDISGTGQVPARSGTSQTSDRAIAKTPPVPDRATTEKPAIATNTRNAGNSNVTLGAANTDRREQLAVDRLNDLSDVRIKVDIVPEVVADSGYITNEIVDIQEGISKNIRPDFDELLAWAIENKDTTLFSESVRNGAGKSLKGEAGGNIFHLLNDTFEDEKWISMLKNKGFAINETDIYGNSPLNIAILSGKDSYARSLINQGADLNLLNKMELSPLHLAAFLNNELVLNDLMNGGADINLKGNYGYTALHIASEKNYVEIAKDLIQMGAKKGIKTTQGLSPKTISKIQNNKEMIDLLWEKNSNTSASQETTSLRDVIFLQPSGQGPTIDFNLPYDTELAKKRKFNNTIQIISIPAFLISAVSAIYMKSEADRYYSLSKVAETEELAKIYYDKTNKFDKNTIISGSVSLVSLYGFIHSTIKKRNISIRMQKIIY